MERTLPRHSNGFSFFEIWTKTDPEDRTESNETCLALIRAEVWNQLENVYSETAVYVSRCAYPELGASERVIVSHSIGACSTLGHANGGSHA